MSISVRCFLIFLCSQFQEGFCNVTVNPSDVINDELDHCHVATAPLHGSSGAWHKLLAATLMCLLFMVSDIDAFCRSN
jgi:hypothetical protein